MRHHLREHAATIIVSALSTVFAATLILMTGVLEASLDPELLEQSSGFRLVLLMVSFIFIVLALYVGSIVTANTFATVIAGRTREIALLRLLGSTSARVRGRVALEGLMMGGFGALIGVAVAQALMFGLVQWGIALGWLPAGRAYPLIDPLVGIAALVVIGTTWVAAWAGSRRVAGVSPVAATGAAVELRPEKSLSRTLRTVWAVLLLVAGAALLGLGIFMSTLHQTALIVSFFGGLISFTGIAVGAHFIMPPMLKLAGLMTGRGVTGRIAAANGVRSPERSARSTIGIVIGVTLVVMFAVALETYRKLTLQLFADEPGLEAALEQTLVATSAVLTVLVGFSAVIAAVGMVNTLSLSVLQRTRELGLLRALGFTGAQVRSMVVSESAQMTLAAMGTGLVLGAFYGWVAAQSMFGVLAGWVTIAIPWGMMAGVVACGVLLAFIAAVAPSRRATRIAPVRALAVT